jgi:hypothetical protein
MNTEHENPGAAATASGVDLNNSSHERDNSTEASLLTQAGEVNWHELVSFGFSVFPVKARDKKPDVASWKPYQTYKATEADISKWASNVSRNAGIVTGTISGIFVLDVDSEEANTNVQKRGLPRTACVKTSRGYHYYFRLPDFTVPNRIKILTGVDIRGEGGYVVGAGSVHESGHVYVWLNSPRDTPLAGAPEWLLDLISPQSPPGAPAAPAVHAPDLASAASSEHACFVATHVASELKKLSLAPEGTRNDTLNAIAYSLGQLVGGSAVDEDLVRRRLLQTALDIGLGEAEARRTLESGLQSGKDNPRSSEGIAREIKTSAELNRLALLSPLDYDRARKKAAEELGVKVSTLDDEVSKHREALRPETVQGQGAELDFEDTPPWPGPVVAIEWLDAAASIFECHAALPAHASSALALWCLHAWCVAGSFVSPRLAIISPEPRCGKTTVLRLAYNLVPRPLQTANATTSVLFRTVEMHRPSLLIDEADTFLTANDELRGLLNSGFEQDGGFLRSVGDDHEPRRFSTWCPVAIALIGKLPATLEDRSVKVPMRRALRGEVKQRLRADRPPAECATLRQKAARWRNDNLEHVSNADPELPEALHDRAQDCWRPLIAIADLAGGEWPAKAREAAVSLSGDGDRESMPVHLLKDIRSVFSDAGRDKISTKELIHLLTSEVEGPWATSEYGRPLGPHQLARRLRSFGISSKSMRTTLGKTPKGYDLQDFKDAFSRYLETGSATPPQGEEGREILPKNEVNTHIGSQAPSEAKVVENQGSGGVADRMIENPDVIPDWEEPF